MLRNFAKFSEIRKKFAKICRIFYRILQKLVDFEKCWKMLYWMQKFMKILLKFDEILTKFWQNFAKISPLSPLGRGKSWECSRGLRPADLRNFREMKPDLSQKISLLELPLVIPYATHYYDSFLSRRSIASFALSGTSHFWAQLSFFIF